MEEMIFKIRGKLGKFPGVGGWIHLPIPKEVSDNFLHLPRTAFGYISAEFLVGKSKWSGYLLPMGKNKGYFVAIKSDIRKKEKTVYPGNIEIKIILKN